MKILSSRRELEHDVLGGHYLFNHKALAAVFRGKLLTILNHAGLSVPVCLPEPWVVDCKHVGNGQKALIYLGRYLYRGVIQERDIVRCTDSHVTFRYRDSATGKDTTRCVSGAQFLWLVLQHVLPRGFRRSRNFGLLRANCKHRRRLDLLRLRMRPQSGAPAAATTAPAPLSERPKLTCRCCRAPMQIMRRRIKPGALAELPAPASAPATSPGAERTEREDLIH